MTKKKRVPLGFGHKPEPTPMHLLIAKSLEEKFKRGDALAPFECCHWWRGARLPDDTLPAWVMDHLVSVASKYFGENADARLDRMKSLDAIAGIAAAGKGKRGAWSTRQRRNADEIFKLSHDAIVEEATRGSPPFEYLAAPNAFEFSSGKVVPVLNKRGEPSDEFRSALAEAFGFGAGWGGSRTRTAKRHLE